MYQVDRGNPTPLYEQIKLILRRQITSGEFEPGVQLPTEAELCQQYQVSRITVVKALGDLAHEGLIQRMQGKGSIVSPPPFKNSMNMILGFTATMRQNGLRPRSQILSTEEIHGDLSLRRSFELPLNYPSRFIRFKRLMFVNEMPAVLFNVVVQEAVGRKMQEQDLDNTSFYKLYKEIFGRPVSRNETTLTPILATPEAIELLGVKPGTPHFLFRGLSFVEGDIPVELSTGIFPGDLFQFDSIIYRLREEVHIRE
jgi:DNA-binding GntR family transcriptional regulator